MDFLSGRNPYKTLLFIIIIKLISFPHIDLKEVDSTVLARDKRARKIFVFYPYSRTCSARGGPKIMFYFLPICVYLPICWNGRLPGGTVLLLPLRFNINTLKHCITLMRRCGSVDKWAKSFGGSAPLDLPSSMIENQTSIVLLALFISSLMISFTLLLFFLFQDCQWLIRERRISDKHSAICHYPKSWQRNCKYYILFPSTVVKHFYPFLSRFCSPKLPLIIIIYST